VDGIALRDFDVHVIVSELLLCTFVVLVITRLAIVFVGLWTCVGAFVVVVVAFGSVLVLVFVFTTLARWSAFIGVVVVLRAVKLREESGSASKSSSTLLVSVVSATSLRMVDISS
jgi:hypothetical protein